MALAVPAAPHAQTLDGMSRVYRSAIEPVYAANEVKGYVMLVDYLRMKKKMGMKLLKLNI